MKFFILMFLPSECFLYMTPIYWLLNLLDFKCNHFNIVSFNQNLNLKIQMLAKQKMKNFLRGFITYHRTLVLKLEPKNVKKFFFF